MFIILLAQFNSVFDSFIVLVAVVLSTVGVLIGMLVMQQAFSIIMTGTGIVALAGIVVNNNIVLIDTYQELSRYMPRIEAIMMDAALEHTAGRKAEAAELLGWGRNTLTRKLSQKS